MACYFQLNEKSLGTLRMKSVLFCWVWLAPHALYPHVSELKALVRRCLGGTKNKRVFMICLLLRKDYVMLKVISVIKTTCSIHWSDRL